MKEPSFQFIAVLVILPRLIMNITLFLPLNSLRSFNGLEFDINHLIQAGTLRISIFKTFISLEKIIILSYVNQSWWNKAYMSSFNSWMFRHINGRVISEVCPGILAGKTVHSEITPNFLNMDMDLQTRDSPLSMQVFRLLENYGWKCSIVFVQISFTHSGSNIAWCWLNLWLCCLFKKSEIEVDGCVVTILTTSKHQQFNYFYCMWDSDWYV